MNDQQWGLIYQFMIGIQNSLDCIVQLLEAEEEQPDRYAVNKEYWDSLTDNEKWDIIRRS